MGSIFRRARLCLIEARPAVQVICLLRFLAGVLLGSRSGHPDPARVAIDAAGWFLATVAIYVYNGVADLEEDVANGSTRPIAAGALSVRFAATTAVLTGAAALACAGAQGTAQTAAMVVYLLVGYAYSGPPFRLKQAFYTSMPSVAVLGLTTYFAGALATEQRPDATLVVFAVANSVWMGVIGGISKDLSDVTGDRAAGRRSWPIVLGHLRARQLLVATAATVSLGFWSAAKLYPSALTDCVPVMLAGALAIAAACLVAIENATRSRRRLPYRAFMWTQQTSHVLLICALGPRLLA